MSPIKPVSVPRPHFCKALNFGITFLYKVLIFEKNETCQLDEQAI